MPKHTIKSSEMNKSVRLIGSAVRTISPYMDEKIFHRQNIMLDKFMKGH